MDFDSYIETILFFIERICAFLKALKEPKNAQNMDTTASRKSIQSGAEQ